MQVIEAWSICKWDSGDRTNHAFYLTSTDEKNKYLETHTRDSAYKIQFVFFDSLEEVEEYSPENVRRRALAKLTPLELQALGLNHLIP